MTEKRKETRRKKLGGRKLRSKRKGQKEKRTGHFILTYNENSLERFFLYPANTKQTPQYRKILLKFHTNHSENRIIHELNFMSIFQKKKSRISKNRAF